MLKVTCTYEVVTPESADEGETADHGFASLDRQLQYSILYNRDQDEIQQIAKDAGADTPMTLSDIVDMLRTCGPFHRSRYPGFDPAIWYTQADPDLDYFSESETRYSYHFDGSTALKRVLYNQLKRKGVLV